MAANQVTVSTPGPAGVAGLTFEGLWVDGSVYQVRDLVRFTDGNLYIVDVQHTASSSNTPLLNIEFWSLFINADDAYQWATKAKHSLIGDSLGNAGYSALHQAAKAQDWAKLTTDAVTNDTNASDVGYSAKAWAIGGTEVTTTASRGAAKEWATTTGGAVDTSEFSAKAYAIGGTGITTSSGKGAAKEWATTTGGAVDTSEYSAKEYAIGTTATSSKTYAVKVDGAVTGTDFSSKAWAVGGTNVTTTASRGAAKEWAISTGAAVDTSEFSAKEYAIGTTASTGGSAKDYATYVGGGVRGATSDHSAKAWSVGGTGVTTTAAKGAAKEWATSTGAAVDTSEYSAKEYAIGTTVAVGSAKDWAVLAEDSVVDGGSGYSALHHAAKGAASATASASSATAARASAAAIANTFDSFDDTYLGSMADAFIFTASSSSGLLLTHTAHGLLDGNIIQVASTTTLPTGLSASTNYYVRDKTTNTFKLATTSGGTAIAFTNAGSGTHSWVYGSPVTNGTWALNSSSITVVSAVGIRVGQKVSGTGIPTSPIPNVLSIVGTTVVISENMAAAGSAVATTFSSLGINGPFNTTKDGPSTDNDGGALADGMLYFNTSDNNMMVYKETGAAWIAASSSGSTSLVMHKFTASGSETQVLAASFSPTLTYTPANIVVFLNGVRLDATDYTASNGNDITGLAALAASDEVVVMAFKSFEVADTVSAASGGTFSSAVTFTGGFTTNTADINGGTFDGIVGGTTPAAVTTTALIATTADINAGTFDGIVGGTTPAAGNFTIISTGVQQVASTNITGTITDSYFLSLAYILTGNVTLSGDTIFAKMIDGTTNVSITNDGSTRTLSGSGTLLLNSVMFN